MSMSSDASCVYADAACCPDSLSFYWDEIYEAADLCLVQQQLTHNFSKPRSTLGQPSINLSSVLNGNRCHIQEKSYPAVQLSALSPSQLMSSAAKIALNAGVTHITSRGKVKHGRFVKPTCSEYCKRCVLPKLTEANRLEIFKMFWDLKDHEKQWEFISRSVEVSLPKRKSAGLQSKKSKQSSRKFFFTLNGLPKKAVCKTMFKNTLCICDSWIDSALSHSSKGFLAIPDRRGHHKREYKAKNFRVDDISM